MYELNLAWIEAGEEKTRTINARESTKHPGTASGTVRIGREPTCDIVLEDPTVSRLHAEIFYDGQRGLFYLRNLKQNNPPMVNGQIIYSDEAALNPGSTIYLGQTEIKVTSARGVPPTILLPPEPPSSQKTILRPPQPAKHQKKTIQAPPPQRGPTPPESPQILDPPLGTDGGYYLACSNPDCTNPDIRRLVSYEHLNVGCPWCGAHLADGRSVFIPRGSN